MLRKEPNAFIPCPTSFLFKPISIKQGKKQGGEKVFEKLPE